MTLYQNSVRGITSEFDPRCRFGHPAMDAAGTWFGRCSNGRASSEGYGVIVDAGGNTIEYLGQTADGMADGNGAMIFSSPMQTGSVYYEGSFSAGQPDGVVLVEEAGSKPRVRTFRAGVDKGSANVDQLQRVAF